MMQEESLNQLLLNGINRKTSKYQTKGQCSFINMDYVQEKKTTVEDDFQCTLPRVLHFLFCIK